MQAKPNHCLVLDVGKTNVKIHILDERQKSLETYVRTNQPIADGAYPHADVDGIWQWFLETLRACSDQYEIDSIAVSAHGATAALIDSSIAGNGLVLPVMDYEWTGVESVSATYDPLRPPFEETCSPCLPAGLNLGRQLMWQQLHCREQLDQADCVLMYPQYWTWRLTGTAASEVSSLGCHTDLWSPTGRCFSSLVESQGWETLFPPIMPAWANAGLVSEEIIAETGLSASCRVHVGVHDSNASLLRFLLARPGEKFCVVSSGTWVVCMSTEDTLGTLDATKDMLANVDVQANPVPCARHMGGREYSEICALTGSTTDQAVSEKDIAQILADGVFALPDFSKGSGPFGGRKPEIRGAPLNGAALATVYCALMVDYSLDLIGARGDVIIVGSYLQNPLLCGLIAQLREAQAVFVCSDEAGTVRGAAQLTAWSTPVSVMTERCGATRFEGLDEYRRSWHKRTGAQS